MPELFTQRVACPYCGEHFETLIDSSEINSDYIEDCQICCRPIIFTLSEGPAGELQVTTRSENE